MEWSWSGVEWSWSGVGVELEWSWSEVLSCYCWTAGLLDWMAGWLDGWLAELRCLTTVGPPEQTRCC